jgi:hypothetical protein
VSKRSTRFTSRTARSCTTGIDRASRCLRSAIAKPAFPIDPPLLRFLSLQRVRSASRCPPAAGCADDPASTLASARASLVTGISMPRPCGFSLPPRLDALVRRVTTESELARAGRSWCRGRHLPRQATAPHASSIFSPASERTSMRDSSAGLPRRSRSSSGGGVRCESCAVAFSFLPARRSATRSLEPSRPRRTLQSIRPCLHVRQRSWDPLHPSQVFSHIQADPRFPHHRAHVPFVRIQLHPIVFTGPNSVTILYWLVNVIRSRRWIRLLGFAPVCGPLRLGPEHHSAVPRPEFLPWVSSSFRYADVAGVSPWL